MNRFIKQYIRHPDDCIRIAKVALDNGYYITPLEAQTIWEDHSDSFAAGWLFLPEKDSEVWYSIRSYFE